jgi:hypothetical protein
VPGVVGDPTFPVSLEALPPKRWPRGMSPKPMRKAAPEQVDLDAASAAGKPESAESRSAESPEGTGSAESAPKKRKVNTSSKGTAIELAAIKVLEAEGYKVHRCVRTGVKRGLFYFSQSNDVFGCIDLVAKKRGTRTRWIQVTADGGIGRKKADLAEVPWDPAFDSVEIWRWVGGNARKHKTTGDWLERQYFQVYHLDHGYVLDKDRRIPLVTPAPTPGGAAT